MKRHIYSVYIWRFIYIFCRLDVYLEGENRHYENFPRNIVKLNDSGKADFKFPADTCKMPLVNYRD
jgi:hypothetical protein